MAAKIINFISLLIPIPFCKPLALTINCYVYITQGSLSTKITNMLYNDAFMNARQKSRSIECMI